VNKLLTFSQVKTENDVTQNQGGGGKKIAQSAVKSRHTVIKYVCHGSTENTGMAYHVGDLSSVIKSGMLPALGEVSIVRCEGKGRKDEKLPVEKFRILGG
jgi:hypothetical protein